MLVSQAYKDNIFVGAICLWSFLSYYRFGENGKTTVEVYRVFREMHKLEEKMYKLADQGVIGGLDRRLGRLSAVQSRDYSEIWGV